LGIFVTLLLVTTVNLRPLLLALELKFLMCPDVPFYWRLATVIMSHISQLILGGWQHCRSCQQGIHSLLP